MTVEPKSSLPAATSQRGMSRFAPYLRSQISKSGELMAVDGRVSTDTLVDIVGREVPMDGLP